MQKKGTIKVEIYKYDEKYNIEIIESHDMWDVWVSSDDYGLKEYVFGLIKGQAGIVTIEDALDLIEANIPQYIDMWEEDFQ